MRLRTFRRRVVAAIGVYGAALLGMVATIVALRELSKPDFARFALVFSITGLLQTFLDTVATDAASPLAGDVRGVSGKGAFLEPSLFREREGSAP